MQKYINFDVMITPIIIKILFWVGVAASVLAGIIMAFSGLGTMFSGFDGSFFGGLILIIAGLFIMVAGTLITRIYCELIIVVFKAVEKLTSINDKLDNKTEDL